MTDEELIGYCELHCTTERALFHVDHLDRMLELAGRPDGYVKTCKDWVTKWYSVHEDEMLPLCNLARERMRSNVVVQGQDEAQLRTVPLERPVGRKDAGHDNE